MRGHGLKKNQKLKKNSPAGESILLAPLKVEEKPGPTSKKEYFHFRTLVEGILSNTAFGARTVKGYLITKFRARYNKGHETTIYQFTG